MSRVRPQGSLAEQTFASSASTSAIMQTGSDEQRIAPCPIFSGRSTAFLLIARKRFLSDTPQPGKIPRHGFAASNIPVDQRALFSTARRFSCLINVKEDPSISFRNWAPHLIRNGLQWKDAPAGYRPHKMLYKLFIRWSLTCVFGAASSQTLRGEGSKPECIMIDATHLKVHRTAASLLKRGCPPSYRANQRRCKPETAHHLQW